MTVFNTKIFDNESCGASLLQVVLAISIAAIAAPFMYKQITRTYDDIENISVAQKIVDLQDATLNFVRQNQENWPDVAEIQMTDEDIKAISPAIVSGFIDKRQFRGTTITDIYLGFDISDSRVRTNQVARQIGASAAVVDDDGVAYGTGWAVAGPDFKPGNLIYRISHSFSVMDRTNFLHRGTSDLTPESVKNPKQKVQKSEQELAREAAQDNLNAMLRNLNMGGKDLLNIGTLSCNTISVKNAETTFVKAEDVTADTVYFSSGANIQGNDAVIDTIRALGDISGFRTITANNLNGNNFSNTGAVITDRATIKKSVRIGSLFKLKSSSTKTISAFDAISSNTVQTSYITANDMVFYGDFGLTVSGELLMSGVAPLKIGAWSFPSNQMPKFSTFTIGRTKISQTPNKDEFSAIMAADWQTREPVTE